MPHQFRPALALSRFRVVLLAFDLAGCITMTIAQGTPPADTAQSHVGKGYEAVKDERYQVAAEEFQAALALDPKLIAARYQFGACLFALGRFQEARQEFERLEKETGGDDSVTYQLARLDLQTRNYDAAIRKLRRVVEKPPYPDTAYYLGTAYLQKGTLGAAEKWLQAAGRADPKDYRVPERLAHVYQRQGRKAEAARQFALSSQLRERYVESAQQAVACSRLLETRPLDEAKPVCDRIFDPDDSDRLTVLGMLYGEHGRYTEALKPLEQANRLDPDSFEISHNLGLSYFQLQRYGEARKALAKAVALCPNFAGSSELLGAALYMLGEDQDAYKVLERAHTLDTENADTSTLLFKEALILANKEGAQKHYPAALAYLRAAAELQPQNQEVQQRIAQLLPLADQRPPANRPIK
jgi:tetratricopeptide (TPR) repeat protein